MKNILRWSFNQAPNILLLISLIFSVTLMFWAFYPYKIIDVVSPAPNDFPVVERGGFQRTQLTYTKHSHLRPTNLTKVIICGENLVTLSAQNSVNLPLGNFTINTNTQIVEKVTPGSCFIEWTAEYKPNPIRDIVVQFRSEDFIIVDKYTNVEDAL